jgi:hypothetical protein
MRVIDVWETREPFQRFADQQSARADWSFAWDTPNTRGSVVDELGPRAGE